MSVVSARAGIKAEVYTTDPLALGVSPVRSNCHRYGHDFKVGKGLSPTRCSAGRYDHIKGNLIQPNAPLSQEPISMAFDVNPACSDIALPRFTFIIPV